MRKKSELESVIDITNMIDAKNIQEDQLNALLPNSEQFNRIRDGVVMYYHTAEINVSDAEIFKATCQSIVDQFDIDNYKDSKSLKYWMTIARKYQSIRKGSIASVAALSVIGAGYGVSEVIDSNKKDTAVEIATINVSALDNAFKQVSAIDSTLPEIVKGKEDNLFNIKALQSNFSKYLALNIDEPGVYENLKTVNDANEIVINRATNFLVAVSAYEMIIGSDKLIQSPQLLSNELSNFRVLLSTGRVPKADTDKLLARYTQVMNVDKLNDQYKLFMSSFILPKPSDKDYKEYMDIFNSLDMTVKAGIEKGDTGAVNNGIIDIKSLNSYYKSPAKFIIGNNRDTKSGVERTENNLGVKRHYLIVQAVDPTGKVLDRFVTNIETGKYEKVSTFGMGVTNETFQAIKKDKIANGVITNNILAEKESNSINPIISESFKGQTNTSFITSW